MQTATDIAMLRADEIQVGDIVHLDGQAAVRVEAVRPRSCHGFVEIRGQGPWVVLKATRKVEVERAVDAAGNLVGHEPERVPPLPDDEPDRDAIERDIAERHAREGRL